MKPQLFCLLLSCVITVNLNGQTTCAGANNTKTLAEINTSDTTEHSTQNHHVLFTPQTNCTYTHGSTTNCNTECSVTQANIGTLDSETGQLNVAGTHMVSHGFNPGSGSGTNGGVSCMGMLGAGATNCFTVPFTQTCTISLSFTGSGFGVSTNGHQVWLSNTPINNSCATVQDPQNTKTTIPNCQTDCPSNSRTCIPCGQSPIVLDVDGNGYQLTDAVNGVRFDISGTGNPIQMGWTAPGSTNAFLALPSADGLVHGGQQLFGNFTPQPPSDQPNGFAALAVYDDPSKGGNGNGMIDEGDSVFALLRLWIDSNHDGISQPEELHTLPSLGVHSISLNYKWDNKSDEFGNVFRYRAHLDPDKGADVGKTIYDIFFVVQTNSASRKTERFVPGAMPEIRDSLR